LADAWLYNYTDFGEGRDQSPRPVLRATVPVSVPGSRRSFSAIIDTGGPINLVSTAFMETAPAVVPADERLILRLGGRRFDAPVVTIAFALHPPVPSPATPRLWTGLAAVIDPWPHEGTAVIFGQTGFLDQFTVTFGPQGFAVEDGTTFPARFSGEPGS